MGIVKANKQYLFRVIHPTHGEVEVAASDRYDAIVKAAQEWGLRWNTIDKDCKVIQLGHTPTAKKGVHKNGR